jgi:hypothetical protein
MGPSDTQQGAYLLRGQGWLPGGRGHPRLRSHGKGEGDSGGDGLREGTLLVEETLFMGLKIR